MNHNHKYGYAQNWNKWSDCVESVDNISENQEYVHFYRTKKSHKGISEFKNIKYLIAKQVDSDFLNEICKLKNIEYLNLEVVTANSLNLLSQLEKLNTLKIYGIRKADDFKSLIGLPSIRHLFIENAKHLHSLEAFSNAHNLVALGVEGGMYTNQKIDSLKPLEGLKNLEALFMSSVQLEDKYLGYLTSIPKLKFLDCARFAPKKRFEELKKLLPKLNCNWCDQYEIEL